MMDELIGEKSYFQILILNATGKLVDRPLADWVEAIYGCLSWPDPRIWCNQIGALAGNSRSSVVAATLAGTMASDSHAYGPYTLIGGVEFIQGALKKNKAGWTEEDIVDEITSKNRGKPNIVGYVRPLAKGDERLVAMERVSENLGFYADEHLKLAYQIEKVLLEKFDEGMNINGYMSGFLSDQGFTPEEVYAMFSTMVASGVTACYKDVVNRERHSFLPLRCEDINYQGVAQRPVPKL